jgi:Domain of unknown function (DUF1413)
MPTIKTKIDNISYNKLVLMRKKEGLPSVSALFLEKCGVLTEETEAAEIFRRAVNKSNTKPSGAIFKLRDLFGREEWERFSKGARLRAGKRFHSQMSLATGGIRIGGKSSSGHQLYTKT